MQAVATMGDHDSFADFGRAARAAARSKRIRQWVLYGAGVLLSWLAAYVKGWEASIVYLPRMERVERRLGALEDAGVGMGMGELNALDTIQRAESERLSKHIDAERESEIKQWRAWLLLAVPESRRKAAVAEYDADVSSGYAPSIAADRAARWSRPPGR